jgi:hypothetical protein
VAVGAGAGDVGATVDEVPVVDEVDDVDGVLLEGVSEPLPLFPHPTAKARSAEPPSTAAAVLTWYGMGVSLSSRGRQTLQIRWRNTPGTRTQTAPPRERDSATEYDFFVNICGKVSRRAPNRLSSADMTDADEQDRGLACGRRIRLTDGSNSTGEIIEDFGDLAGTEVVIDASRTARSRRWAVALDDGRTVFVDDDALELTS